MPDVIVHQYRLRNDAGRWLADVVMRSDGYFSCISDYGNYAYWWGSPGREFRSFVAQLVGQDQYVCSKLAKRDWWDGEATLRGIREYVVETRRNGGFTKAEAAKHWEDLNEAIGAYSRHDVRLTLDMDRHQFHTWYNTTTLGDAHEFATFAYPPDVRGFCREVMPVLSRILREEIAAEDVSRANGEG